MIIHDDHDDDDDGTAHNATGPLSLRARPIVVWIAKTSALFQNKCVYPWEKSFIFAQAFNFTVAVHKTALTATSCVTCPWPRREPCTWGPLPGPSQFSLPFSVNCTLATPISYQPPPKKKWFHSSSVRYPAVQKGRNHYEQNSINFAPRGCIF